MISLVDICDMCELDHDQIDAIAEHEHIPEVAAAAFGHYLLHMHHGAERIRQMIRDDIHTALVAGDKVHARELVMALRHLYEAHPELRLPAASSPVDQPAGPLRDDLNLS